MTLTKRLCYWLLIGIVLNLQNCRAKNESNALTPQPASQIFKNSTESSPAVHPRVRRAIIRYPTPPAYVFEPISRSRNFGIPNVRFQPPGQYYPPWRQHKSFWRPPGPPPGLSALPGPPPGPPVNDFRGPVMGHRTPRLIFRDDYPVATGPGVSNNFFQTNQLQDVEDYPDHAKQNYNESPRLETDQREFSENWERKTRQEKRPLWKGDDSLCADGRTCEFFLMCWMSAGLLDGSCGGIMFACCHRSSDAAKASSHYSPVDSAREQTQSLPTDNFDVETTNEDRCGISADKQTAQRRIVGGDEAGFGTFPWQAYIRIGSSRCGGTLVNRFHVVTAGHCVAKASARQVQVTLGDYVVNSATETLPAYTFGVREIRVHPYFKFTPQADRFDVAVLRLDRPVHYMPHISPICLPDKNEDFLGQYGWAAGWGALQAGSRLRPKTLQAVDVPVIDNRICERWHRSNGINVVIYDEMMCAGYRGGGKDSCQGDSGGPLMLERTGRWYLIGIVSAGYSCAQPGQPGIYHRVAKTVDWITYVINS